MIDRPRQRPLLALAMLLGASCGEPASATHATEPSISAPTPPAAITATDTKGIVAWIAAQRGKPVLVNFWATWCGPCLAELPDLMKGTRAFRERGGAVLGVAMEQMAFDLTDAQAIAKAQTKANELGLDFPNFVCTDDDMKVVRAVLGVELGGLPQTLTYDRSGALVTQHEGKASADEFAELGAAAER